MPQQSPYHNYTAADIERYYKGLMTKQEMHAIEKAALDDPFLADALEGYRFTQTPAGDIKTLQQKLLERANKGKVMGIWQNKTILRIAVMVILVAGLGWATYQFTFIDNKDIAINQAPKTNTPLPDTNHTVINTTDAVTTGEQAADKNTLAAKPTQQKNIDAQRQTKSQSVATKETNAATLNDTITLEGSMATAEPLQNKMAARSAIPISDKVLTGKVVDDKNNPVPYATITNRQNNITVQADEKGNFKLPVKDSVSDITVNSVGYQTNRAFLSAQPNGVKITLQETENSLNEVVVANAPPTRKAENRFTVENAEPAKGWVTFNKYVAEQLEVPEDEDIKNIKGEVKVSFDVNAEGEAENIKIEKSLCNKCDAKVVQIIKEGTKWLKGKKKKKATARIKF